MGEEVALLVHRAALQRSTGWPAPPPTIRSSGAFRPRPRRSSRTSPGRLVSPPMFLTASRPSRRTPSTTSSGIDSTRPSRRALTPVPSRFAGQWAVPSLPALPVGLYVTASLPTLPPNRPASARRTRRVLKVRLAIIASARLVMLGPGWSGSAIPEQRTRGAKPSARRCRQAAEPVAVARRAAALIARTAAQRRLRFLRHHSLDEGADAKADRSSRGSNQFSPENGLGDVDAGCFMA